MDKKRKIFIDGGAHIGEYVKAFLLNYKLYNPLEFEIYSFEPRPDLIKIIKGNYNLWRKQFPDMNIQLNQAALSTTDAGEEFYITESNYSSTLREDNSSVKYPDNLYYKNIQEERKIRVKSVDLNKFILSNFSMEDYIVLKLDIEGGEYDILPHMIRNGSIKYVNELFIEWHHRKLKQCTEQEHNKLVETLKTQYNLEGKYWSAKYCDI